MFLYPLFLYKKKTCIAVNLAEIMKEETIQFRLFDESIFQTSVILKVQSCKLYSNKYVIASTQITNTEVFAFIAVIPFKSLSRKVLFINRKDNRNC